MSKSDKDCFRLPRDNEGFVPRLNYETKMPKMSVADVKKQRRKELFEEYERRRSRYLVAEGILADFAQLRTQGLVDVRKSDGNISEARLANEIRQILRGQM